MSAESEHSGDHPAGPTVGIVLAAGAGTRMGRPKALVVGHDREPWLRRAVRVLSAGGCAEVIVVLGAAADDARALLSPGLDGSPTAPAGPSATPVATTHVVVTDHWADGLSASLRAGLDAARALGAAAAVVTLVDLPWLTAGAVQRLLTPHPLSTTLRQAVYDGRPGHPVVIGRVHFEALIATLHGDVGARPYLAAQGAETVDCTDLGGGDDVDSPRGQLDAG
ncbi:MAG: nucleotidyltransferase family protein [Herbiconiux sp.]|uniref:nucleotidyltransferase family protein n=1 Tax=Herbiconiux sp. TaxID=1871186 RepID=UPI0012212F92|nr:nucleotidyltransferase family protein [Herbiconiux sp.]TAJ48917.1 MAG: nucleotidyltransferase family protein [Herbiconiux sp.]